MEDDDTPRERKVALKRTEPMPGIPEQPIEPLALRDPEAGALAGRSSAWLGVVPESAFSGIEVAAGLVLLVCLGLLLSWDVQVVAGTVTASVGTWPWFTFEQQPDVAGGYAFLPASPSLGVLAVYLVTVEVVGHLQRHRGRSSLGVSLGAYALLLLVCGIAVGVLFAMVSTLA